MIEPSAQPASADARANAIVASVNGAPLHRNGESLTQQELRQRAGTELLRQAALAAGLLERADRCAPDGVISEAASDAIDALLERDLMIAEPSDEACRRHFAAHAARYQSGEKVHARHILFALTAGMDIAALRNRAEACLLDVRCHDGSANENFSRSARAFSNCPSGAEGGDLGWLSSAECAPELAQALFGQTEVGVLARLVHSRFGLHVVEVLARRSGVTPAFETVHGAVSMSLRQISFVTALRQYLQALAAAAQLRGVELESAATELAQ